MMLPSIGANTRKLAALSYARVFDASCYHIMDSGVGSSSFVSWIMTGLQVVSLPSSIIFSSHLSIRIPGSEM